MIGEGPALKRVLQAVETVAPTDATVLLRGETGTGKELLARAIHNLSPRHDRTFVRLNAAALPATLIESELFGYEKGAFTGRLHQDRPPGTAHRGTLFLDEVGDIPLEIQPSCCVCCRRASSSGWAAPGRSALISVSSRPPTATWSR